tara:strand:+ start:2681 stop:3073 length:393 start_codon:yes stop_codon:yes gene_type:complete
MQKRNQKFTYYAFYRDKSVKLGYSKNVLTRLRQLGGASSCFIVFRAEHDSTRAAQKAEKRMKEEMASFVLQNAECREWLNSKKKGFFSSLRKSLESLKYRFFGYAINVDQKSSTTWEETSPAKVEKLVRS